MPEGNEHVRVLIADDEAPFVQTLSVILELEETIEIVGAAGDGVEAVDLAASLDPDVVLMDVEMPRLDGLRATEQIREWNPSTRVVMLTGSGSQSIAERARQAGAADYVTKDRIGPDLVETILATA